MTTPPTELPDEGGTVDSWRRRFAALLSGLEHPPLGMGVALAEECGEVAKLLLDHYAYGKAWKDGALAGELADVMICVFEIATAHRIDLDDAVASKYADLCRRVPEWKKELLGPLQRAREQQQKTPDSSGPSKDAGSP